jgi:hypothetical protein
VRWKEQAKTTYPSLVRLWQASVWLCILGVFIFLLVKADERDAQPAASESPDASPPWPHHHCPLPMPRAHLGPSLAPLSPIGSDSQHQSRYFASISGGCQRAPLQLCDSEHPHSSCKLHFKEVAHDNPEVAHPAGSLPPFWQKKNPHFFEVAIESFICSYWLRGHGLSSQKGIHWI